MLFASLCSHNTRGEKSVLPKQTSASSKPNKATLSKVKSNM
jgi:hypothetical protein